MHYNLHSAGTHRVKSNKSTEMLCKFEPSNAVENKTFSFLCQLAERTNVLLEVDAVGRCFVKAHPGTLVPLYPGTRVPGYPLAGEGLGLVHGTRIHVHVFRKLQAPKLGKSSTASRGRRNQKLRNGGRVAVTGFTHRVIQKMLL
eukprot:81825-Rhodomonas_salina.1